ncbi:DUF3806 domain-containing protein [Myroides injenensis]|uniref:DUF3806 domain-containing protein n=2 Tax=Myroides injenensis TaxID=1183151 RepID=UPI000288704D|nr:DUF3806 domain-containing protein [Myroides injenensis]
MKLIEIGDGCKAIKVPSKYFSEWEGEHSVVLYTEQENEPIIRISVISTESDDARSNDQPYQTVIEKGLNAGYEVKDYGDRSYFCYRKDSLEEGLAICYYEIGVKGNFVILSVTTSLEEADSIMSIHSEVEQMILTIEELSLDVTNIFEPKYSDIITINNIVGEVLKIDEDEIDEFHNSYTTLTLLQDVLDQKGYLSNQESILSSLGFVFGDFIQFINNDYRWVVVRDNYGRDLALQYKNYTITLFPITMILKRIEAGEEVVISALINSIFSEIENIANSGNYKELDYNY